MGITLDEAAELSTIQVIINRESGMLKDFKKFVLRGNVVDLAVAVVVGAAFGAVVTSLVENFVTPLIAAVGGLPDFTGLKFTINDSAFYYGRILNAIISFLSIAAVVFFFVVMPLNKLMAKAKPSDEVDKPSERECPECLSGIPAAATRCKYCGATSKPTGKEK
jgi:large conductance mechanosensitive channel